VHSRGRQKAPSGDFDQGVFPLQQAGWQDLQGHPPQSGSSQRVGTKTKKNGGRGPQAPHGAHVRAGHNPAHCCRLRRLGAKGGGVKNTRERRDPGQAVRTACWMAPAARTTPQGGTIFPSRNGEGGLPPAPNPPRQVSIAPHSHGRLGRGRTAQRGQEKGTSSEVVKRHWEPDKQTREGPAQGLARRSGGIFPVGAPRCPA